MRPPEFETDGFSRAVFYRSPDFAIKGKMSGAEKDGRPTREKTREITREKTGENILALIGANPEITTMVLAKETGLTEKGIEWNINRLKESGRLRRVGPDKGGHWEVIRRGVGTRKAR